MFEVPDVAVPDAPRERDRPHDPVAFERAADPRVGAKRSEVSGGEPGGGLEDIGWRSRYQIDRPPDRIASVQGALRAPKHFDALQVEELRERHRRSSEVHAVEIHRRTRIRPGEQRARPNPADRELTPTRVLGKRD